MVSADKGLAGSFNSNIIKAAGNFIIERPGQQIELTLVGRKARDFFRRRGFPTRAEHVGIFSRLESKHARAIGETAIEDFTAGKVDARLHRLQRVQVDHDAEGRGRAAAADSARRA